MDWTQEKANYLIEQFNRRDTAALGEIYSYLYDQLYYFTLSVCRNSDLLPDDVIHDVFIKVWLSSDTKFLSIESIKAYMFTSIRNLFRNHIVRKKLEEKYMQTAFDDEDLFVVQMVESGVWAHINQAIDKLPHECTEVIKYHLEGWYTKEIAEKMGISERTVYNRKKEALELLKTHLNKEMFSIIALAVSQL